MSQRRGIDELHPVRHTIRALHREEGESNDGGFSAMEIHGFFPVGSTGGLNATADRCGRIGSDRKKHPE